MANFKYTAYSSNGEKVNGVIEALTLTEAVKKVKETCPIVEEIKEVKDKNVQRLQKVNIKELCLLCARFAIVLEVGLPIVQSVEMMAKQTEDANLRRILEEVQGDVAMGRSLSASFAVRGHCFPSTFVETIKSGEETGELAPAFKRLNSYYEKSNKTTQKVVGALTYPAIVMVVAVVVMAIIMVVAVPSFTKAFDSLGTELPWITRFVIGLSDWIKKYGLIVVVFVAAIVLGCKLYGKTEKGAVFFASTALKLPLVGKIIQLSGACQFAQTMSMMVMAGMPILRCIETAGRSVGNYVMRRDILETATGVQAGKTLGACLSKSRYLPAMLVEMTAIGESTGTLESTLETVGNYYDNETQVATAKALSFLEPAIIGVLAVFVVGILFSVYLPMFSMYGEM